MKHNPSTYFVNLFLFKHFTIYLFWPDVVIFYYILLHFMNSLDLSFWATNVTIECLRNIFKFIELAKLLVNICQNKKQHLSFSLVFTLLFNLQCITRLFLCIIIVIFTANNKFNYRNIFLISITIIILIYFQMVLFKAYILKGKSVVQ